MIFRHLESGLWKISAYRKDHLERWIKKNRMEEYHLNITWWEERFPLFLIIKPEHWEGREVKLSKDAYLQGRKDESKVRQKEIEKLKERIEKLNEYCDIAHINTK